MALSSRVTEMKFIKINGVIRHSQIQSELEKVGLKEPWIDFVVGNTMCAIDENDDFTMLSNQGVYPVDLKRFCSMHQVLCEIEDEGVNELVGLTKATARELAIANCRLSGLTASPKMLDLVDQMNAGQITTKEAIEQLLGNRK